MKKIIAFIVAMLFAIFVVSIIMTIMGFIGFYSTNAVIELSMNLDVSKNIIWCIAGGIAFILGIVIFIIWKKDEKF